MILGDDWDSSDEEWEQHIGRNARAFLGLNEPVAEIALDEGVGLGLMVRNALTSADNIHERACGDSHPLTGDTGRSPTAHNSDDDWNSIGVHTGRVRSVDPASSTTRTDLNGSRDNMSTESLRHESDSGSGRTNLEPNFYGMDDNGEAEGNSSDYK